jgi:hypothetical protein
VPTVRAAAKEQSSAPAERDVDRLTVLSVKEEEPQFLALPDDLVRIEEPTREGSPVPKKRVDEPKATGLSECRSTRRPGDAVARTVLEHSDRVRSISW